MRSEEYLPVFYQRKFSRKEELSTSVAGRIKLCILEDTYEAFIKAIDEPTWKSILTSWTHPTVTKEEENATQKP